MAKQRIDNFLGGTVKSELGFGEMAYTQNMYFESVTDGGVARNVLRSIEGMRLLDLKDDIGNAFSLTGAPRGVFVTSTGPDNEPRLFVVFGDRLYVVDRGSGSGYTVRDVANVGGNAPVSMCETGGESPWLCVAYGDGILAGKIKDLVPSMRNIALPVKNLSGGGSRTIRPSHITYQFGFLTCNDQDTDYFYRSYNYPFEYEKDGGVVTEVFTRDPLTEGDDAEYFNEGFYIPSDWKPDVVTCMASTNATLFTFGPKSMQLFKYTGDANMPFNSPDTSALSIGILAPHSVACIGNQVFWLGSSDVGQFGIYRTSDTNPQRISTPEIEREIMEMAEPADAIGFCWTQTGHSFYAITFVRDQRTFVFDTLTGLWHNRVSTDPATGNDNAWRYGFPALFDDRLCFLCGDGIAELALATTKQVNGVRTQLVAPKWTEHDGNPIVRLRRGGAIVDGFTMFCIDNVQFKVYNRMPMAFSFGSNRPRCNFRWSKNGEAFDNRRVGSLGRVNTLGLQGTKEMAGVLGKVGEFAFVTQFPRLGVGTQFTFELSCAENIPFDIVGCVINWTPISRGF